MTNFRQDQIFMFECSFDKLPGRDGLVAGKHKLNLQYPLPESYAELELDGYNIFLRSKEYIPDEFIVKFRLVGDHGRTLDADKTTSGRFCRSGNFDPDIIFRYTLNEIIRTSESSSIHFQVIFQWDYDIYDNMYSIYGMAFEQQLFADIKLIANNGNHIMASKLILSAHSDVFRTMFESQFWEMDKSEVTIDDDYLPLLAVVRYMYDRTFDLYMSTDQALALMLIADKVI